MTSVIPNLVWAQRTDRVFITVQLTDIKTPEVSYTEEGEVYFKGVSGKDGRTYEIRLPLYAAVNVQESRHQVTSRCIEINLKRKETGAYWPRLTKESGKYHYIKVDWDKWRDEDDEDDEKFDVSKFGGSTPNFGDFGGNDSDSESEDGDDDLPDLESSEEPEKVATSEEASSA